MVVAARPRSFCTDESPFFSLFNPATARMGKEERDIGRGRRGTQKRAVRCCRGRRATRTRGGGRATSGRSSRNGSTATSRFLFIKSNSSTHCRTNANIEHEEKVKQGLSKIAQCSCSSKVNQEIRKIFFSDQYREQQHPKEIATSTEESGCLSRTTESDGASPLLLNWSSLSPDATSTVFFCGCCCLFGKWKKAIPCPKILEFLGIQCTECNIFGSTIV